MALAAGRLRERVTIRRARDVSTGRGGYSRAWDTVAANIAAEVIGESGRESVMVNTLQGIATYRVTVRYRDGIRAGDQVLWRGQELNILAPPSDPTGRYEFLQFRADTSADQNASEGA